MYKIYIYMYEESVEFVLCIECTCTNVRISTMFQFIRSMNN